MQRSLSLQEDGFRPSTTLDLDTLLKDQKSGVKDTRRFRRDESMSNLP